MTDNILANGHLASLTHFWKANDVQIYVVNDSVTCFHEGRFYSYNHQDIVWISNILIQIKPIPLHIDMNVKFKVQNIDNNQNFQNIFGRVFFSFYNILKMLPWLNYI